MYFPLLKFFTYENFDALPQLGNNHNLDPKSSWYFCFSPDKVYHKITLGILGIILKFLEFLELYWNSWNYLGIIGILWEFLELSEFFYELGLPHDENFQLFPPRIKED
jgi:hypothetical protein